MPKEANNGNLRIKQYSKYLDNEQRLNIANTLLEAKVQKSYELLVELSKFYEEINVNELEQQFADELKLIGQQKTKDLNKLLMCEGRIAGLYWDNLKKIFNKLAPEFNYQGRKNKSYSWNMNASDEINALLNYGYAILEAQVKRSINTVGFDPSIGYLHEIAHSKYPLQYDIQELYRWLIDLSVIELLEEKRLKKSDFIVTENYHIRLKEQTANALIEKIKMNFNRKVKYKTQNYMYATILLYNVQTLSNYIIGKHDTLVVQIPGIKINRTDNSEIREEIMDMLPEERRQLGIRRNTLWYMKKNIQEGKKIKIYNKVKTKIISE